MDQWSDSTWKAWFYALLGIAVLVGMWLNIELLVCPVPKALLSGETAVQPACFEFWLNRYQTLIGTLAAIGAAFFAWRGVMRQVDRADAQISIMQQQAAAEKISIFDAKLNYSNALLGDMTRFQVAEQAALTWIEEIGQSAATIADFKNSGEAKIDAASADFQDASARLAKSMEWLFESYDAVALATQSVSLPQYLHMEVTAWLLRAASVKGKIENIASQMSPKYSFNINGHASNNFETIAGIADQKPDPEMHKITAIVRLVEAERNRLSQMRDTLVRQAEGNI